MISPWTEPGTKVVVCEKMSGDVLPNLPVGLIVVVDEMVECDEDHSPSFGDILVRIKGINHDLEYPNHYYRWYKPWLEKTSFYFYERRSFNHIVEEEKREALPESVTRLLDTKLPEVVG